MNDPTLDGLINNETGLTPDEMRQHLEREGWFGRVEPDSTSHQDLLDLLKREARGKKVFHPEDPDAQALADREVMRAEIDLAGITNSDSKDEAALKLLAFRRARPDLAEQMVHLLENNIDLELLELPEAERSDLLARHFIDLRESLARSRRRLEELERFHKEAKLSRIGWRIVHEAILAQRALVNWLKHRVPGLGGLHDERSDGHSTAGD